MRRVYEPVSSPDDAGDLLEPRLVEFAVGRQRGGLHRDRAAVAALDQPAKKSVEVECAFARQEVAAPAACTKPPVEVLDVHVANPLVRPQPLGGDALRQLAVEGEELGVERRAAARISLEREAQVRERGPGAPDDRLDREGDVVRVRRVQAGRQLLQVALDLLVAVGQLPQVENERLRPERRGGAAVHLELLVRVVDLVRVVAPEPRRDPFFAWTTGKEKLEPRRSSTTSSRCPYHAS